jgi:hypothetical protein
MWSLWTSVAVSSDVLLVVVGVEAEGGGALRGRPRVRFIECDEIDWNPFVEKEKEKKRKKKEGRGRKAEKKRERWKIMGCGKMSLKIHTVLMLMGGNSMNLFCPIFKFWGTRTGVAICGPASKQIRRFAAIKGEFVLTLNSRQSDSLICSALWLKFKLIID